MRHPRRIQPLIAINLVVADNVPHPVGKNFRPAARQRVDPSLFHFFQRLADRQLRPLRQIRDFHHRESLHVHLRKALFQPRNQVEKILKRQIGMQPAHNMKLGDRLRVARSRRRECLFERHRIRPGLALLEPERAQPAARHAHVGLAGQISRG